MKKTIALLLAVLMVVALCAGCGGKDSGSGDLDAYKEYVIAYAKAGAPTEDEGNSVADAINACASAEEIEAVPQLTVLFLNAGVLNYDAWVEAGCPEADTSNMTMGDPSASGEASGEPSAEPAAE